MVDLMLVRRLSPLAGNVGKRLVRSPKVFVRDSGVVHALLGLTTFDDLISHPVVGGSWEGWVIENLLAVAPQGTQGFFYRTAAGAELDLLLELPRRRRWAIEIKRSSAPSPSKGFHVAAADVKATQRYVVHSGSESFPIAGQVQATTLLDLQRALMAEHAPARTDSSTAITRTRRAAAARR